MLYMSMIGCCCVHTIGRSSSHSSTVCLLLSHVITTNGEDMRVGTRKRVGLPSGWREVEVSLANLDSTNGRHLQNIVGLWRMPAEAFPDGKEYTEHSPLVGHRQSHCVCSYRGARLDMNHIRPKDFEVEEYRRLCRHFRPQN